MDRHEVAKCLAKFAYFESWSNDLIEEVVKVAKLKKFEPEAIVLGDGIGQNSYVYFIVRGQCNAIETISPISAKQYFIQVYTMHELACFNLGEDLNNRIITAGECGADFLLLPHYWLFEHNNDNIWMRIRQFLNWKLPKTEQIIQDLIENAHWKRYRAQLINKTKKRSITTNQKIPFYLQLKHTQF